jgi:hypothetical protein
MPISTFGRAASRLVSPAAPPAVGLILVLGVAIALPLLVRPLQRTDDDPVTPSSALAAAERLGLEGPIFNSEGFGGYLTFRGIPTFIDGRAELYGNAFLDGYLMAERGDEPTLNALLARYGVTWTLLKPQQGAVSRLDVLPGWRRVYTDAEAVIHMRVATPDPIIEPRQ